MTFLETFRTQFGVTQISSATSGHHKGTVTTQNAACASLQLHAEISVHVSLHDSVQNPTMQLSDCTMDARVTN